MFKIKILYIEICIIKLSRINSTFFLPMSKEENKIKNLKISLEVHNLLKNYCDKNGIKMYRFLERLIVEKCKEKKDIYGDN